ncbi:hypothetical protein AK812_SmicGene19515 [Symbiodinium microadriaticum]|uniref:C2H2-type domain-containing protein n=1 Tax=Symbiodinium microadriaticum TaxID=2951 RepID=A0A1Q9DSC8_SYMMI|nr:hypothetical protein AK812_SmicGene19515 [Symbiodinium microadriaticum]
MLASLATFAACASPTFREQLGAAPPRNIARRKGYALGLGGRLCLKVILALQSPHLVWAAPKCAAELTQFYSLTDFAGAEDFPVEGSASASVMPDPLPSQEGSGRCLGVQIMAPNFQHVYLQVPADRCASQEDVMAHAVVAATNHFHHDFAHVVPTDPQIFQGYATFVAETPWLADSGQVVVVLDLLRISGNRFACMLPNRMSVAQLLAYIAPLVGIDASSIEIHIGATVCVRVPDEAVQLVSGQVITAMPPGILPHLWGTFEDLLAQPDLWGPSDQFPRPLARAGICLLHEGRRFFVNRRFYPGQPANDAAAQCDNVLFFDLRPLLQRPIYHYQIGQTRHWPTVLSSLGVYAPRGMQLQIEGASHTDGFVDTPSGHTIVVHACWTPPAEVTPPDAEHAPEEHDDEDQDTDNNGPGTDSGAPSIFDSSEDGSDTNDAPSRPRSRSPRRYGAAGCCIDHPKSSSTGPTDMWICSLFKHAPPWEPCNDTPVNVGMAHEPVLGVCWSFASQALKRCWSKCAFSCSKLMCQELQLYLYARFILYMVFCLRVLFAFVCAEIAAAALSWCTCVFAAHCIVAKGQDTLGPQAPQAARDARNAQLLRTPSQGPPSPLQSPTPDFRVDHPAAGQQPIPQVVRHWTFVVLYPQHSREDVAVQLPAPCHVQQAIRTVSVARDEQRQLLFGTLTPVVPQPADDFGTLIATPATLACCVVCVDLRQVDGRFFCLQLPDRMNRESLIAAVGLTVTPGLDVFVGSSWVSLAAGQMAYLQHGILLTVLPILQMFRPGVSLHTMLLRRDHWIAHPELPRVSFGRRFWVLTDAWSILFDADNCTRDSFRPLLFQALRSSGEAVSIQPVLPGIDDYIHLGCPCEKVTVATEQLPKIPIPPGKPRPRQVICILDQRPILRGLTWKIATEGRLLLASLVDELSPFVPALHHVSIVGGSLEHTANGDFVHVWPGQVLLVHFLPDAPARDEEDSDGQSSAGDSDDDEASDGDDPDPRTDSTDGSQAGPSEDESDGNPVGLRSRSPRRALFLPLLAFVCALLFAQAFYHNDSTRAQGHLMFDPTVAAAFLLVPALLPRAGGCSRSGATHGFALGFHWAARPAGAMHLAPSFRRPLLDTDDADSGANPWKVLVASAHNGGSHEETRRPIPTPCRVPCLTVPRLRSGESHLSETDADDVGAEEGSASCSAPGSATTKDLLEDLVGQTEALWDGTALRLAASDPRCAAFAVAIATLEVLFQHHGTPPAGCRRLSKIISLDQTCPHPGQAAGEGGLCPLVPPIPRGPDWDYEQFVQPYAAKDFAGIPLPCTIADLLVFFASAPPLLAWQRLGVSHAVRKCLNLDALHRLCADHALPQQCRHILCFTDGSFHPPSPTGVAKAGWACVFIEPLTCTCSCAYGSYPDWLLQPSECLSAYLAECAALVFAGLIATGAFRQASVCFLSDCQAALGIASGSCTFAAGGCPQTVRHVIEARRQLAAVRGFPDTFEYIPGHKGHFANELADKLSKHGALHGPAPGAKETLKKWLEHGAPWLPWAATVFAPSLTETCRHTVMPPAYGNLVCEPQDHAGLSPAEIIAPFVPVGVLEDSASEGPVDQQHLVLRVLSFNTLSLGSSPDKGPEAGAGLTSGPARAALLADQLKANNIVAAALQETRSDAGSTRVGGFLRYAAGSERGQFGTEWWFLDGAPLTQADNPARQHCFDAQALTIVFADCRRLFIRYSRPGMHILFISLHAPHRATEHHLLEVWWRTTLSLVFQHRRSDWIVVAGDFNCALGSIESRHVGPLAAEEEDLSGAFARRMLRAADCWAPSTFEFCHVGGHTTYVQKRNGRGCRVDYVCLPCAWQAAAVTSSLMPEVNAAHATIDHTAVMADCKVALTLPGLHLGTATVSLQAAPRGVSFHDVWSSSAWFCRAVLADAWYRQVLDTKCRQLRSACRQDRAAYISELAQRIATRPNPEVFQEVHRILMHKRKKPWKADPLPMIRQLDGSVCEDAAAVQARWRQHFGGLEAGIETTPTAIAGHALSQPVQSWPLPHSLANVPDITVLQRVLAAGKLHKAAGPDGIPAELGKAFPIEVADILLPLLLKFALRGEEAVGFKSGLAIFFWKGKGSQQECGADGAGIPETALANLSLSSDDVERLRSHVCEPSAFRQAGADPWTEAVSHCITDGTFFLLRDDPVAVATERGTRPGSSWADILFATVMQRVLKCRTRLRSGLLYPTQEPRIPWDGQLTLQPCSADSGSIPLDEVVWADDLAIMRICRSPTYAPAAMGLEAGCLVDAFREHGFALSFGSRKTAILASPAGAGSRKLRQALFGPQAGGGDLCVLLEGEGAATVPLVSSYKHLGAMQGPKGGLRAEIAYRTGQATAAYNEGRRKVYRSRAIPPQRKAFILRTAVIPKLTFGCGSWPPLTGGEYKKFSGCLWRMYRSLLCLRHDQDQDLSFHACLSLVGLPSPLTTLRMHRLLYIGQLMRSGPDALWALIRADRLYADSVLEAFRWFHALVGPPAGMQSPSTAWAPWADLMSQRPGLFKGMVKRAVLFEQRRHTVIAALDGLYRGLRFLCEGHRPSVQLSQCSEMCVPCKRAFASRVSWSGHAARCHGYRSQAYTLGTGRICEGCGKTYASSGRLRRHLVTAHSCRERWGTFLPAQPPPAQVHPQAPPSQAEGSFHPKTDPRPDEGICHPLLKALLELESASVEDGWHLFDEHVAPLATLRHTVTAWANHETAQAWAPGISEDLLLLLDPVVVCDNVQAAPPQRACPADVVPQWPSLSRIARVTSGPTRAFVIPAPPPCRWLPDTTDCLSVRQATAFATWIEGACRVIAEAAQVSQSQSFCITCCDIRRLGRPKLKRVPATAHGKPTISWRSHCTWSSRGKQSGSLK